MHPLFPYQRPAGKYYTLYADMLKQPHLLIAGATGSGKSVIINGLIYTALYSFPDEISLVLIDPKRVELSQYKELPHCIGYASEPDTMKSILNQSMQLCEAHYKVMARHGLRKYDGGHTYIIIDEFADLMTVQRREVQPVIQRLAQIGRAANIHLIIGTQSPIAKIIPTEIKCNFDSRVALRTRSAQDSRNILGVAGCELLPRYGQCYYMTPDGVERYKVPMYDDKTLQARVDHWTQQRSPLSRFIKALA